MVTSAIAVVGQQIKIARKRRGYNQSRLAKMAMTSRDTIRRLESGDPAVSFGIVCHVLWALQLTDDIVKIADPQQDEYGIASAERSLPKRIRLKEDDEYDF